jgi:hypothetical protein
MSATIHFISGKTLDITQKEFDQIAPKLQQGGVRLYRTGSGSFVPLNSMTMELIERHFDEEEVETPAPKVETIAQKPSEAPEETITPKAIPEPTVDPMEDILAKSNCKHEPEKMEMYIQHTAKGIRYFPVCSFCGKRERYVSESKIAKGEYEGTPNGRWTMEDITSAKVWVD